MAHPKLPFEAYKGDGPYIFVSYPHEDAERLYRLMKRLHDLGFNLWYDEGLEPGHHWPQELADRIAHCDLFLLFVTRNTLESSFCMRETNFAVSRERNVLGVHLDDVKLSDGLEFAIGDRQSIIEPRLDAAAFSAKLLEAVSTFVAPQRVEPVAIQSPEPNIANIDKPDRRGWGWLGGVIATLVVVAVGISIEADSAVVIAAIWILVSALGGTAVWARRSTMRSKRLRWAHETLIPEVRRSIDNKNARRAYEIVLLALDVLGEDPTLVELRDEVSNEAKIETDPPGAEVHIRPFEKGGEWSYFGQTPVSNRLPTGAYQLKVELPGYTTVFVAVTNPSFELQSLAAPPGSILQIDPVIHLDPTGTVPEDMVRVPALQYSFTFGGMPINQLLDVPSFFIDRYAVSNRDYKTFVDEGGYENADHWSDLRFEDGDATLTWDEALDRMRDSTDRHGPANWSLGEYADGEEDYPVTGISWFEAMAYARYRDKSLPTVFHWLRAAFSRSERGQPLTPAITAHSNFGNAGLVANGSLNSMGPYGMFDLAGNAREWILNGAADGERWILGGAWSEESYAYNNHCYLDPWDRSDVNGFRCLKNESPYPEALDAPYRNPLRDYTDLEPASPEVLATYRAQLSVTHGRLNPSEPQQLPSSNAHWHRQRVEIDAGYDGERMAMHLFFPVNASAPFQSSVFFPGMHAWQMELPLDDYEDDLLYRYIEPYVRSGRAVLMPVWNGSFERNNGFLRHRGRDYYVAREIQLKHWRQELSNVLDYVETRDDLDSDAVMFSGVSFGEAYTWPLLALEKRLKGAILCSGGLPFHKEPAMADGIHYLPEITIPVTLINGTHDTMYPQSTRDPVRKFIGSSDFKQVELEAGHFPFPRNDYIREVTDWCDKHLGPVPG